MKKTTILLISMVFLFNLTTIGNTVSDGKPLFKLTPAALKSDSSSSSKKVQLISIAPIGLINKFRVKYEKQINDNFTYGAFGNIYWGFYKGVRIDPIFRFYLGEEAPEGIYLQAKLSIGVFNNPYKYWNDQNNVQNSYWFGNGGAGINIGYQTFTGKSKHWAIDINVGFKIVTPVSTPNDYNNTDGDIYASEAIGNGIWYLTGPGSIFDGHIGVGYVF